MMMFLVSWDRLMVIMVNMNVVLVVKLWVVVVLMELFVVVEKLRFVVIVLGFRFSDELVKVFELYGDIVVCLLKLMMWFRLCSRGWVCVSRWCVSRIGWVDCRWVLLGMMVFGCVVVCFVSVLIMLSILVVIWCIVLCSYIWNSVVIWLLCECLVCSWLFRFGLIWLIRFCFSVVCMFLLVISGLKLLLVMFWVRLFRLVSSLLCCFLVSSLVWNSIMVCVCDVVRL